MDAAPSRSSSRFSDMGGNKPMNAETGESFPDMAPSPLSPRVRGRNVPSLATFRGDRCPDKPRNDICFARDDGWPWFRHSVPGIVGVFSR